MATEKPSLKIECPETDAAEADMPDAPPKSAQSARKARRVGEMIRMWAELITMERGAPKNLKEQLGKQRLRLESIVKEGYEKLKEQPKLLAQFSSQRGASIKKQMRRVVTGTKDKRIRDFIKEKSTEPPVARWLDQISFTIGVLAIIFSEFILLHAPELFWLWYLIQMSVMIGLRIFSYHKCKWQYFLIDFCYFANFCCFAQVMLAPRSCLATKINFVNSHGPLLTAIVAWRNSLVFHDVDKMTTVYLHMMPSWLLYSLRWFGHRHLPSMGSMTLGQYLYHLLAFFLNPKTEFGTASSLSFQDAPPPEASLSPGTPLMLVLQRAVALLYSLAKPCVAYLLRYSRYLFCLLTVFLTQVLPDGYVTEKAIFSVCDNSHEETFVPVTNVNASVASERMVKAASSYLDTGLSVSDILYGGQTADPSEDVAVFTCNASDLELTWNDVLWILGLYMFWQVAYVVKTEILDAAFLDADPSISTSLRWISGDRKHPMHRMVGSLLRNVGVMGRHEEFNSKEMKTKLIFVLGQLVYTVITMVPTVFFLNWWTGNVSFLLLIVVIVVYNGGGYYMKVFAQRYESGLEKNYEQTRSKIQERQGRVADSKAATDAYSSAAANGDGDGELLVADSAAAKDLHRAAATTESPVFRDDGYKEGAGQMYGSERRGVFSTPASSEATDEDAAAYESDINDFDDFEEFKSAVYDDQSVALRTAALLNPDGKNPSAN
eukprot:scaffold2350_cov259-Pinguiococcus_pyrenoidosus.AAC.2